MKDKCLENIIYGVEHQRNVQRGIFKGGQRMLVVYREQRVAYKKDLIEKGKTTRLNPARDITKQLNKLGWLRKQYYEQQDAVDYLHNVLLK